MASDSTDDVNRLFACFKCGISTPQSAPTSARKKRWKRMVSSINDRDVHQDKTMREVSSKEISLATNASLSSIQEDKNEPGRVKSCTEESSTPRASKARSSRQSQISPVVFYGSPHGVPAKRPLQLWRLLYEIRADITEQNDFKPRYELWETFPKQDQAMTFAKNHAQVHLFSYQDHLNTQRRFLVTTYEEFWRRYKTMDPKFRHHYEIIQEGLPCHLYFDLEFDKRVNAEKNGDEMVDLLISVIFDAFHERYSIQADHKWIVELDSSTEDKFSRHLIIRVPGAAFKDNSHAGVFVAEICSRINNARASDPNIEKLYVSQKGAAEYPCQLFIDTAVYSRNRCFRLVLSSKAGKRSVLLPSGRFKSKNMNEKEMFMDSLICKLDADCRKFLRCRMDLDCIKVLQFDSEVNDCNEDKVEGRKEIILRTCANGLPGSSLTGKSPFPALDKFIESIASTEKVPGQIRCWYWFSEYGLMMYSMLRSRYCERIGREHKSNHVMYIVNFQNAGYYQKCYDPDCRGYRSPLRLIPLEIIPDETTILNLTRRGDNEEIIGPNDATHGPCSIDKSNTDSCKKDGVWWHEAIKLAEDVENMRKPSPFAEEWGNWHFCDDQDWWDVAERSATLVEQQTYLEKGIMHEK